MCRRPDNGGASIAPVQTRKGRHQVLHAQAGSQRSRRRGGGGSGALSTGRGRRGPRGGRGGAAAARPRGRDQGAEDAEHGAAARAGRYAVRKGCMPRPGSGTSPPCSTRKASEWARKAVGGTVAANPSAARLDGGGNGGGAHEGISPRCQDRSRTRPGPCTARAAAPAYPALTAAPQRSYVPARLLRPPPFRLCTREAARRLCRAPTPSAPPALRAALAALCHAPTRAASRIGRTCLTPVVTDLRFGGLDVCRPAAPRPAAPH